MIKKVLFLIVLSVSLSACLEIKQPYTKLPPGTWRGVILPDADPSQKKGIDDEDILAGKVKFEAVAQNEIPFLMEVSYADDDEMIIKIINGDEVIIIDSISFGLDRSIAKDTFTIPFTLYNKSLKGIFAENVMEGHWIDHNEDNYKIPFVAYHGQDYRFASINKEVHHDLTGNWRTTFYLDEDRTRPAIGEFLQNGNHLSGTFITESGDYRYLDGTVQEDKFYLSTFDGAVAYLFEGKIIDNDSIIGLFRSGKTYQVTWSAIRDDQFELTNPESMTAVSGRYTPASFPVSLQEEYNIDPSKQKLTIIQVLGTWCRNCLDETNFFTELYDKYREDGLEIVAISFEKARTEEDAFKRLNAYKTRLNVNYPIVLGALSTKGEVVMEAIPVLQDFRAYPTTIFIDSNNNIRKVHTGIYGPATGKFEDYKNSIVSVIENVLYQKPMHKSL